MATPLQLASRIPKLYLADDVTGDFARLLAVYERLLGDVAGSTDARATLDGSRVGAGHFDTVLEAATEGRDGGQFRVSLGAGTSPPTIAVGVDGRVVIGIAAGVSTVGDVEDAISALAGNAAVVRVRRSGTRSTVLQAGDYFTDAPLRGASPAGFVWGKVSVDAQRDLLDPLRIERRLLPYLAQRFGWDLDTSSPEALQRKALTLAEALFRQKGTKAGIIAALRLLLGLDVVYRESWADGWRLGRSLLGEDTVLAPSPTAPGYSWGTLKAVAPSLIPNYATLTALNSLAETWALQTAPGAALDTAAGWMVVPELALLANNLTLTIPIISGSVTFEIKVDSTFQRIDPAHEILDLSAQSTAAGAATAMASQMIAVGSVASAYGAILAQHGALAFSWHTAGAAGNAPFGGSALDLFDGVGMAGGTAGGGAAPPAGVGVINLQGLAGAEDVARTLRGLLTYFYGAVAAVTRGGNLVSLRWLSKGPSPDGAIGGTAAALLSATGMAGGTDVSPRVLTFSVEFPRHLTDAELRAATQVVDYMRRAETHCVLINPPASLPGRFRLGRCRLGTGARLDPRLPRPEVGNGLADPDLAVVGRTFLVPLTYGISTCSPPLVLGARYRVTVDDDAYVRQGNRQVMAGATDLPLPAGTAWDVVVPARREQYVAAERVLDNPGDAFLRLTRLDG